MATKGERQALLFLAGVVALGAGVRAWRARPQDVPIAALDRQIAAVETTAVRRGTEHLSGNGRHGRGRGASRPARSDSDSAQSPYHAAPAPPVAQLRVDVDAASAVDIARLPGVGMSLARRIVADREKNGPFGCLTALDAVKGVGPAMVRRLDTLVVFGGAPRTACR